MSFFPNLLLRNLRAGCLTGNNAGELAAHRYNRPSIYRQKYTYLLQGHQVTTLGYLLAALEQGAMALKRSDLVTSKEDVLVHAYEMYDSVHREPAHWLVRISRRQGEVVKWEVPGIDGNCDRIHKDMDERIPPLLSFDWQGEIRQTIGKFARRIKF